MGEGVETFEGPGNVEHFEAGEEENAVGEGREDQGWHGNGRRLDMSGSRILQEPEV